MIKLAALIQKGGLLRAATATVATLATLGSESTGTVATVAKVAVAKGHDAANGKAEPLAALNAEPLPDPRAEAELRRLVNLVADAHGFSPEDRAEALEVALRDLDRNRALMCFRALAAKCSATAH